MPFINNKYNTMKKLLKYFSNKTDQVISIIEHKMAAKTNKEIIEEIHESFYTEVDKLLSEAKISKSLDTDKQDLIDKCNRLKALGFTNTKEVKEAELEIKRLNQLKIENETKKGLIEAINYFSFKYPNYKFITEDSVKKICEKYSLVYGGIDRYIGTVPDKNLKHIEEFKIKDEDIACIYEKAYRGHWSMHKTVESLEYHNLKDLELHRKIHPNTYHDYHYSIDFNRCPMEIAAPVKDFNMSQAEVKDFKISKIEIPDPVVLQPVVYSNQKYYLIVTAWGEEASDELVVNQKMN